MIMILYLSPPSLARKGFAGPYGIYQHVPVKVRIEGHEELLCGSFHAEDPHYTTSPTQACQRRRASRVRFSGVGHVHVI